MLSSMVSADQPYPSSAAPKRPYWTDKGVNLYFSTSEQQLKKNIATAEANLAEALPEKRIHLEAVLAFYRTDQLTRFEHNYAEAITVADTILAHPEIVGQCALITEANLLKTKAHALFSDGQYAKAADALEASLEIYENISASAPRLASTNWSLAMSYRAAGQTKGAIQAALYGQQAVTRCKDGEEIFLYQEDNPDSFVSQEEIRTKFAEFLIAERVLTQEERERLRKSCFPSMAR